MIHPIYKKNEKLQKFRTFEFSFNYLGDLWFELVDWSLEVAVGSWWVMEPWRELIKKTKEDWERKNVGVIWKQIYK